MVLRFGLAVGVLASCVIGAPLEPADTAALTAANPLAPVAINTAHTPLSSLSDTAARTGAPLAVIPVQSGAPVTASSSAGSAEEHVASEKATVDLLSSESQPKVTAEQFFGYKPQTIGEFMSKEPQYYSNLFQSAFSSTNSAAPTDTGATHAASSTETTSTSGGSSSGGSSSGGSSSGKKHVAKDTTIDLYSPKTREHDAAREEAPDQPKVTAEQFFGYKPQTIGEFMSKEPQYYSSLFHSLLGWESKPA